MRSVLSLQPQLGAIDIGDIQLDPQALFMMNSKLMDESSKGFAEQLERAGGADEAQRIQLAHLIAFGRPADAEEVSSWGKFLNRYETAADDRSASWRALCRVLLSSNEFLYVQ